MAVSGLRWHDIVSGHPSAGLNPEIELFEDWNDECYDLYGVKVTFYELIFNENKDKIYGEDTLKEYVSAGDIDILLETGDYQYEWGAFGPVSNEIISFQISIRKCNEMEYTYLSTPITGVTPKVGDLLLFHYNNLTYQIQDLHDDRTSLFPLNHFNYKGILVPFQESHEESVPSAAMPLTGADLDDDVAIEDESDTIIDYDTDDNLDDDIYGSY